MTLILTFTIVASALPAWAPILWKRQWWPPRSGFAGLYIALVFLTAGAALQLAFLFFVGSGLLELSYSHAFARVGIPCCMAAAVIAVVAGVKNAVGINVSSFLSLLIRLFVVSVH